MLVGTITIEKSEHLSGLLKRRGIKHSVLNAKYHEQEAEIIAQAGRFSAVTIATNMAGRGTDILLGGNPDFLFKRYRTQHPDAEPSVLEGAKAKIWKECEEEKARVIALGGLRIIGTERHESRRIDNQLRGRSGRQGDPGSSRFYLSLEDDLLRIFGSDRISKVMEKLGMEKGVPIEHRMVTRAIENAQRRVEGHNFDIRKHLLEYDDVMNKQRSIIYSLRRETFSEKEFFEIRETMHEIVTTAVDDHCPQETYSEEWDFQGLRATLLNTFQLSFSSEELRLENPDLLKERLVQEVDTLYLKKETHLGAEMFHHLEKQIFLRTIDTHWKDHLLAMDYLKEGIGLRGYGQKEPLSEYKREGYDMFVSMIDRIKRGAVEQLFRVQMVQERDTHAAFARGATPAGTTTPVKMPVLQKAPVIHLSRGEGGSQKPSTVHREEPKIGRNDPCTCGSGKKYKKCHGK